MGDDHGITSRLCFTWVRVSMFGPTNKLLYRLNGNNVAFDSYAIMPAVRRLWTGSRCNDSSGRRISSRYVWQASPISNTALSMRWPRQPKCLRRRFDAIPCLLLLRCASTAVQDTISAEGPRLGSLITCFLPSRGPINRKPGREAESWQARLYH